MEQTEKRGRDALADLQKSLTETMKRIEALETAQRSTEAKLQPQPQPQPYLEPLTLSDIAPLPEMASGPMAAPMATPMAEPMSGPLPESAGPSFDLPPFADAPPFPSGSFEPPRPSEESNPMLAPEAADAFQPVPDTVPPEAQDYLAQARKAARAASEDIGARNARPSAMGGFGANDDKIKRMRFPRISRPVAAVFLGLVVISSGILLLRDRGPRNEVVAMLPNNAEVNAQQPGATPAGAAAGQKAPGTQDVPPGYDDLAALAKQAGTGAQGAPGLLPAEPPAPATGTQAKIATPAPPKAAPTTPVSTPKSLNPPPPPTPIERLTSKATAGDPKAALVLGLKYADGDGVAPSDPEAVRWLQKAAEAGEAVAQYRLGTLYEKGRGVAADPKKAAMWYSESAKQGNRKAMHNLAVAYADGAGVDKNFAEAVRWFKEAAELGLTDSQFNLAVLYERGLGVPASLSEAYKWYSIASAEGDNESKTRVDALTTQLQAAEKDMADKAVKAFKPRSMTASVNEAPTLAQVIP